jgi:hypothetical protein
MTDYPPHYSRCSIGGGWGLHAEVPILERGNKMTPGEKFKANEFKVEFTQKLFDWYKGGELGEDPRGQWESSLYYNNGWISRDACEPNFSCPYYRWKPAPKRTVVIDGVELVAPEITGPAERTPWFYEGLQGDILRILWVDCRSDRAALANGKVFLTPEDCQAMADMQKKQRIGGKV